MNEYLKIQSYAKFYTQIMILELFQIKYQIQKHIKKKTCLITNVSQS